jgi:uncharacterized protein (TIGR00255 family)
MINSMTGFARRDAGGPWGELSCELRSVNHRFLEISFRLPEELRAIEPALRTALGQQLRRGKVDCSLHWRAPAGATGALEIDTAAMQRVLAAVSTVAQYTDLPPDRVNPIDVLRWPGVVRETRTDATELQAAAQQLLDATAVELAAARGREGARLAELLAQRCNALTELTSQVRTRLPEIEARVRTRLEDRLGELRASVDPARLEQELVLLLQRLDVAEELDRLTGHLEEIRRVIASPEAAGRRLDFLMQELNREANTLASKSQDLGMTRISVDMKVNIEQMREQVQNIE